VVFYEAAAGRSPVRDYADSLSAEEAARLTYDLNLLAEFGLDLGMPHVRPVRGKLWELRSGGRIQHRVLYAAVRGRQIVLLHAFTKKTPKTPPGEIAVAERRFTDYQERFGG
jgi:phage-related protein